MGRGEGAPQGGGNEKWDDSELHKCALDQVKRANFKSSKLLFFVLSDNYYFSTMFNNAFTGR